MKENEKLKILPLEVQNEVVETLKYWSGCYVFQNEITKTYKVGVGIGISSYKDPNICIASFENTDIYTDNEIQENNKNNVCNWF